MGTVVISLFLIDMLARTYKNFHIERKQQPASAKINCLFRKRFIYLIFLLKPGATLKHKHVRWNGHFLYRLKKSVFIVNGKGGWSHFSPFEAVSMLHMIEKVPFKKIKSYINIDFRVSLQFVHFSSHVNFLVLPRIDRIWVTIQRNMIKLWDFQLWKLILWRLRIWKSH